LFTEYDNQSITFGFFAFGLWQRFSIKVPKRSGLYITSPGMYFFGTVITFYQGSCSSLLKKKSYSHNKMRILGPESQSSDV